MISLTLPEPPSSNRWWRRAGNHMHLSTEAREYKADTAIRVRALGLPAPLSGPISVALVWYRSRKSGDLDKRQGVLLDALQGVCYENDSQIVELHAYRSDAEPARPRVEVRIREVPRPGPSESRSLQLSAIT